MKLKLKIFKKVIQSLVIILITLPNIVFAQNKECKLLKYRPNHIKVQYAGGTAFLSAGVGYSLFNDHLDISGFYGYVPKSVSIDDLHNFTLQFTAKTLHYNINKKIEVLPLNVGFILHHTFGHKYWVKLPKHYPHGYYWWTPGRNIGFFFGGEARIKIENNKYIKKVGAYYGLGTGLLYIASSVTNSSIDVTDLLKLGIGIVIYR